MTAIAQKACPFHHMKELLMRLQFPTSLKHWRIAMSKTSSFNPLHLREGTCMVEADNNIIDHTVQYSFKEILDRHK